MHLGIFGGTFDPPHIGHLALAFEACHQLELDNLLWVLTPCPPHKPNQPITPLQQRIEMVQAIVKNEPKFELSRVEIDRPAPHFAVDTVEILGDKYPNARLVYLLGGDSLRDLPFWRQAQKFTRLVDTLGVMHRPRASIDLSALKHDLPNLREKLFFIEAPLLQISSTDIRQRVRGNRPYRYLLPPLVDNIIIKHGLYASRF
ncbi:MAG: nicotinate (nicotinamide) nucleotide adenylyltransferase [Chloroflexota bacterium]|nr:MAG: nicotinate (nicotinamide) nucleotide adenylyltransferase [Chloroflexota bacterium]